MEKFIAVLPAWTSNFTVSPSLTLKRDRVGFFKDIYQ